MVRGGYKYFVPPGLPENERRRRASAVALVLWFAVPPTTGNRNRECVICLQTMSDNLEKSEV